ncbi:MAG: tetratricopeptide repeat protein [Thermodesulfobacteriota bacterium]
MTGDRIRLRRPQLAALGLVLLATLAGAIAWRVGKEELPDTLSFEPIAVVENHRRALAHWAARGLRRRTLVHLDSHDDLKRIPEARILVLKRLLLPPGGQPSQAAADQATTQVEDGNFLYAAAKLGIIDTVYWVVPVRLFTDQEQLPAFLHHHNFSAEDIAGFRYRDGCFHGRIDEIPLNICGIETLPSFRESVLLSIDVDFFPTLADSYGEWPAAAVGRALQALAGRLRGVEHTLVAYSVDGGHLKTRHRWVGDLLVEALRNPWLLAEQPLPARYAVLQQAERLCVMGRHEALLDEVLPRLSPETAEPALLTYLAGSLAELDADAHAYLFAEQACLANRSYCYGLCELACSLLGTKGLAAAERFFQRAYQLHPGMAHGQFRLARALQEAGRLEEAVRYFGIFRERYGPFPADFYLGRAHLLAGDTTRARAAFDSARQALLASVNPWSEFGDAGIVQEAIRFYEEHGSPELAQELRFALEVRGQLFRPRPHPEH